MPTLNMVEALNLALVQAMDADDRVVVLGEDVAQTGGVFRVTAGLLDRFGDQRIFDTPLAEAGIVGSAIGMSIYGMLPVVEIQFDVFVYPGFEQIVVQAARYAWRTKGEVPASLVIRIPFGGGVRAPELHSDSPEALFAHVPGLKVVCPTTPRDARDMLLAAIEDPDPVIFMEPKRIYRAGREEVPDEPPFALGNGAGRGGPDRSSGAGRGGPDRSSGAGRAGPDRSKGAGSNEPTASLLSTARTARQGDDLAIFTYGPTVPLSLEAADALAVERGVQTRVVDLRSLYPLDVEAIEAAASACGRALVVHEAPRHGGLGAEVSSLIHERVMLDLEAPVMRVTGFDVPFPQFANEDDYLPSVDRIKAGALKVLDF